VTWRVETIAREAKITIDEEQNECDTSRELQDIIVLRGWKVIQEGRQYRFSRKKNEKKAHSLIKTLGSTPLEKRVESGRHDDGDDCKERVRIELVSSKSGRDGNEMRITYH
jgi:hypothetical protein